MLPEAAVTHFGHLCTDGITEQWRNLSEAQRAFERKETGGRGQGYAARLAALYQEQLKARGRVILEAAKSIHERFGLPSDEATSSELKALAEKTLDAQVQGLRDAYERHLQPFGITAASNLFEYQGPLTHAGVLSAIGRHLWEAQNVPMPKQSSPTPTMTFNGPVGAVQTGANAVANVSQSWSGENVANVVKALAEFKALLQTAPGLDTDLRTDLLKDVESASTELAAPTPNAGRLTRWLGGVGTAVQTVGALQPAWDAVKVGLRALGLPF